MRSFPRGINAAVLLLALMAGPVFAQIPLNINYQARLTSHDTGEPVPDASYPIEFRFYADSTGGTPVWIENYSLPTSNGYFTARLGGADGMDISNFGGRLFMEVVVDSEVMIPRTPFSHVPYSAVAQRVIGDIVTSEGSLRILDPADGEPAVEIGAVPGANMYSFKMIEPGDDGTPAFELMADGLNDEYTFKMIEPADDDNPAIELRSNMGGSSFKMNRYSHDYGRLFDGISMMVDGITNTTSFRLIEPANDDRPGVEITARGLTNAAQIRMLDPTDDNNSLLEINADLSGASMRMFNPQPEPPADPLLEMNTDELGATFAMTAPASGGFSSDIANPLLRFHTDSNGGRIDLKNLIGQYMGVEPTPFQPGGRMWLQNPVTEDLGLEMIVDSNGGKISLHDQALQYMGVEPSPFPLRGGLLMMIDPLAVDTTIKLLSNGEIVVNSNSANLESRLTAGGLLLRYKPGPALGPPISLQATATDAKVGIGTDTPEFRFDLKSSGTGDGLRVAGSAGNQLFRIRQNSDGSCETQIADYAGATRLMLRANGASYFSGGAVGIGTTAPTDELHVVGNIRMVDGSQGAGKVLTSDANGVGTWQNPTAIAGEQLQELRQIIESQNERISQLEREIADMKASGR